MLDDDFVRTVAQMALANPDWDYRRYQDELREVGFPTEYLLRNSRVIITAASKARQLRKEGRI